jgi:uncharacterized protein
MSEETIKGIVDWQNVLGQNEQTEITFHGGEPLVPGVEFYRTALPLLRDGLAPRRVRFAVQSNLWFLTDELCELFREFRVSIGTSLDGPVSLNDKQRGHGYYRRTMNGIKLARSHGIDVGCICTFTKRSARHTKEIFDFFLREGLNFSVHAAMPSLRYSSNGWALSPSEHGQLLVDLFDLHLQDIQRVRISTLDSMARSVSAGHAGICTFGDCLGGYLAVGPDGRIYPCQRFVGIQEYSMGEAQAHPSLEQLSSTTPWREFQKREERIKQECGECAYFEICKGGCPYNALAAHNGSFGHALRDPHCEAYKRTFDHILERSMEEVFSTENMEAVIQHPDEQKGFLRHGRLLSLMQGGPHPHDTAQHALRILAAVALASSGSPSESAQKFLNLGLAHNFDQVYSSMLEMHTRLLAQPTDLNNLYLHVTFACNLRCTHCYAEAGLAQQEFLPVEALKRTCPEALHLGFRHAVITGGEPLVHPYRDALLDALWEMRQELKPMLTVLRTSMAVPLEDSLLVRLGKSTDQVVVSVDGDRKTHDDRRGAGTYDLTVGNLRKLVSLGGDTDISIAAVLPLKDTNGAAGDSVRALAKELGISRLRFRPLLPLGRAMNSRLEIVPETLWSHIGPNEMIEYGFNPTSSCGMGQNLYVEPDGTAYPCYAWHSGPWKLGSIKDDNGLGGVIKSTGFESLRSHSVNTNHQCKECPLRYLCGGACRAWSRQLGHTQRDLDASPADCSMLHVRAISLLLSALAQLGISEREWRDAGLPVPQTPPSAAT